MSELAVSRQFVARIEVTQADIDLGTRGHCQACPIAYAVERYFQGLFPGLVIVPSVGQRFILATLLHVIPLGDGRKTLKRYQTAESPTPPIAQQFIRVFDWSHKPGADQAHPIVFYLPYCLDVPRSL